MNPFHDFGGHGKKLYFFHANGFPPLTYMPLIKHLLPNYHVLAMNLRPLWPESDPAALKDWNLLVTDLLQCMQELNESGALGMGHSMGATVMLFAALQKPDLFASMALLDPVLFNPRVCFWWGLIKNLGLARYRSSVQGALRRRHRFLSLQAMYQNYRQKTVFSKINDEGLQAYVQAVSRPLPDGQRELVYSGAWEAQIYATAPHRVWSQIKNVKPSLLCTWGRESNVFDALSAKALRQRVPQGFYHEFPEATHLLPMEKPKEVADLVLQFLP